MGLNQSLKHGIVLIPILRKENQSTWPGPHFTDVESEALRSDRFRATQRVSRGARIPTQAHPLSPDYMLLTTVPSPGPGWPLKEYQCRSGL